MYDLVKKIVGSDYFFYKVVISAFGEFTIEKCRPRYCSFFQLIKWKNLTLIVMYVSYRRGTG